jgi:hypothetical protein
MWFWLAGAVTTGATHFRGARLPSVNTFQDGGWRMLRILVTLCLQGDPAICKEVRMSYPEEAMTAFTCFMTVETEMPKVISQNPNWFVKKWECSSRQFAEKI